MDTDRKDRLWGVIRQLTGRFEAACIPYSIDASAVLFVHGIDLDVDDVDVTVQRDCFDRARETLVDWHPSPVVYREPWLQCHASPVGEDVHLLTTDRMTDLAANPDRLRLTRQGFTIWSLSLAWAQRHTPADSPRSPMIQAHLARRYP